jgi:nitroimidazol reductase NimA-like FMN-containing flavoprotein (pyridoxamine 5'-phosphate oxidase superfamily)
MMRRSDLAGTDPSEIARLAQTCEVGFLGINDPDGFPRVIPLNFVLIEEYIYFHGATEGEKFEALKTNPKVTFSYIEPYSLIPSHWLAKDYACPATIFFKSVYMRGVGSIVSDPHEKAIALQALMEKHQPEGRFRTIRSDDPMYTKAIAEVGIFRISPERVTTKFKLGQNESEKHRRHLIDRLRERGTELDIKTAAEIEGTL